MKIYRYIISVFTTIAIAIIGELFLFGNSCFAEGFTVSPINQDKVLIPGSQDIITITLANAAGATSATEYEISLSPFSMSNDDNVSFEDDGNYSQIVNWISFDDKKGVLEPNESRDITFTVNVPEDAPAGGQYCAIIVTVDGGKEGMIDQKFSMSHLVFAEVAGETIRKGELNSIDVSSFLFSGNITAGASITNLGNVHSRVKHTLQVYPLIGGEELYTNEEKPQENVIMPEATRYTNISWEETPSIGVFRVKYTVEFEGVKNELDKIVIVCPLWLIFIIVLIVILIAAKIIFGKKQKD